MDDKHKNWKLNKEDMDLEFARDSLIEELEAINNYKARISEASSNELKKVLQHNMDEEKEHTAMLIEWMRKNDKKQNEVFGKHD